jgi:hypothetical protein
LQVTRDLLLALQDYSSSDVEVELLAKFIGGVFDADDLSFFVHGWSRILPLYQDVAAQRTPGSARRTAGSDEDEAFFLRRLWLYDDQCRLLVSELFDVRERAVLKPSFWRRDLRGYVLSSLHLVMCVSVYVCMCDRQRAAGRSQAPVRWMMRHAPHNASWRQRCSSTASRCRSRPPVRVWRHGGGAQLLTGRVQRRR